GQRREYVARIAGRKADRICHESRIQRQTRIERASCDVYAGNDGLVRKDQRQSHQVDERKAPSARRQQMQTGPGRRDHDNAPAGKINRVAADQYQPEARKRRTSRHRAAQDDHREPSLQHCWLSGCLMVVRSCSRPKARSSWPLVQYVSSLAIAAEQSLLAQSQDAWTACGNCADAVVLRNSSHRLSARTKSSTSRLALSANNVKKSAADTQLARPAAVGCSPR